MSFVSRDKQAEREDINRAAWAKAKASLATSLLPLMLLLMAFAGFCLYLLGYVQGATN
jgi:hypothetical protein